MNFSLLPLILPDYCCSCGQIGAILCESCYYDIVSEPDERCVACRRLQGVSGKCVCQRSFARAWCVGAHVGALRSLVAASKFNSAKSGCKRQAQMLDETLPTLPSETIIVPVPTIARHIRTRGYGHAERIAKDLARRRQLSYQKLVSRQAQFVQHGATKKQRLKQAKQSYKLKHQPVDGATYLLIDDVYTTGATLDSIARLLNKAGVSRTNIWVAVTSRHEAPAN